MRHNINIDNDLYFIQIFPRNSVIVLAGLTNLYTHYVTTLEEYQVKYVLFENLPFTQTLRGADTLFSFVY